MGSVSVTKIIQKKLSTDSALLQKLTRNDEEAWIVFERKYSNMIRETGEKKGLSEQDCEDLKQEVLLVCCRRFSNFLYDRKKGRFRDFLYGIIRNIIWQMDRKKENPLLVKDYAAAAPEYDEGIDSLFMAGYEKFLLETSLKALRERVSMATYSAFEMLCIQNLSVEEVCAVTRKSRGALYLIRHRCIKLLKDIIRDIPEAAERIHGAGNSSRNAEQI